MTTTIKKRFEWDAAHRVHNHEGQCRFLHGHRYAAEVQVTKPELDPLGRVIDFSVLKKEIGEWILRNWDHNIILHAADPLTQLTEGYFLSVFNGRCPFIMPNGMNTTAEHLAHYLFEVAENLLRGHGLTVNKVVVYETPTSSATYTKEKA